MDRRVIEGIEACRPASDDLGQPELADVAAAVEHDPQVQARYRQTQAWDAAIRHSMEQVAVPDGLADRILQQIAASEQREHGKPLRVPAVTRPGRFGRRAGLAAAASVAAAVMLAVGIQAWLSPRDEASLETLADRWMEEIKTAAGGWRDMATAPAAVPISDAVSATAEGWQTIGKSTKFGAVAYRLRSNVAQATLFVLRLPVAGLPAAPPRLPQLTTGGKSTAYWRSGHLVYVLVVDGNAESYRTFVSTSSVPLA